MPRNYCSNVLLATRKPCLSRPDRSTRTLKVFLTFRVFLVELACELKEFWMIANFGFGVLFITFLVTLYSVFAAIYGERRQIPAMVESARRAMLLTWPLLTSPLLFLFTYWSTIIRSSVRLPGD